ncbi:MAG: hypothetical protein QM644_00685 [Mobilitalea sp.]
MEIKKIIAAIVAIGLIVLLLLFVNSWVGNPFSKTLAKKSAKEYVTSNYKDLDLQIIHATYNFKFSNYIVRVQSSISPDTVFNIYTDDYGKVQSDDYDYEVANHMSTWRRLDSEMHELAKSLIIGKLAYDFDNVYLSFAVDDEKDIDFTSLTRDMELDIHNPPLPLQINVSFYNDEVSYDKIAEIAKSLEALLKDQNISVSQYNIRVIPIENKPEKEGYASSWVDSLSVSYLPADKLQEDNLSQVIEQFEQDRVAEYNETYKK